MDLERVKQLRNEYADQRIVSMSRTRNLDLSLNIIPGMNIVS